MTGKVNQDSDWLERYQDHLAKKSILELGCGDGKDTRVLQQYASSVIAADLNPEPNPYPLKVKLNHANPLPFPPKTFEVAVASLCLHYFNWQKTQAVFNDVSRILKKDGLFICRLNSNQDAHYGAGSAEEIEPGLFHVEGQLKRFFNEEDVHRVMDPCFDILTLEHKTIDRYRLPKSVFEVTAIKKEIKIAITREPS